MAKYMTTKERLLAAIKGNEVDYIPMHIIWNVNPLHRSLTWENDRQKLELHRDRGWDTYLTVFPTVTPTAYVKVSQQIEKNGVERILFQNWMTPAGEIKEKLNATEDWDELSGQCQSLSAVINWEKRIIADDRDEQTGKPTYLEFMSDFRTSRYIEYPFKDMKDLDALEYLFPLDNPDDTEKITREYYEKRKLADEFGIPLFTYLDSGMDWLMWLYPANEAVMRVIDDPEYVKKLLSHINKAKLNRLKLLLRLRKDIDCYNPCLLGTGS